MRGVMQTLNLDVRPYVRVDRLVVAHTLKQSREGLFPLLVGITSRSVEPPCATKIRVATV